MSPLRARPARRPRFVPIRVVAIRAVIASAAVGAICAALCAGAAQASSGQGSAPADRAASYLVSQLTDGDHYVGSGGTPNYGITIDIALGLAAAGSQPATVDAIAAYLDSPDAVAAYTHGVPFDEKQATYAGPTAKLALTAMYAGLDPSDFGGEDLLANLAALETVTGRFSDVSKYGDNSNVLGQSFAVLAQTAATGVQPDGPAVDFLIGSACTDGGFPITFPTKGKCESSPDATGAAVQALDAANPVEGPTHLGDVRTAALIGAVQQLEVTRSAEGWWEAFDAPSVNSTAYAAMGLLAVGQDAATSIAWLTSIQGDDGGLPITPGNDGSDAYATAQALEALASSSFLAIEPSLLGRVIDVPPSNPTSTPTITTTPTSTATATIQPSTSPSTSPSGNLPKTGADKTEILLLIAGLLVLLGIVFMVMARRLRGRP